MLNVYRGPFIKAASMRLGDRIVAILNRTDMTTRLNCETEDADSILNIQPNSNELLEMFSLLT